MPPWSGIEGSRVVVEELETRPVAAGKTVRIESSYLLKIWGVHVEPLDATAFTKYSTSILNLEEAVWRQSGDLYASQPWGAQNFTLPLPGKEEFSFLVLGQTRNEVSGFLVAHTKYGNVHMSRIAVSPETQNQGVAMALYAALFRRMGEAGISIVTAQTPVRNERVSAVYETMRFERLREDELRRYLASHSLEPLNVAEDRFTSSDGWTYFAYQLVMP